MKAIKRVLKTLSILMVVGLVLLPANFTFATNVDRELTDRENAAFIVRDEWTTWVKGFTASLSELDKNATSRIYTNMDYYDMQYRFTEKYKKVPEYLDEDGKPTQKLKDMIKEKRKELSGAKARDGFLAFTSTQNGSRISYNINGSLPNLNIGYSYDMISWTKWDGSRITLDNNETIYVWNKSDSLSIDGHNALFFEMSGSINASGNVNSLINFREDVPDYSFYCLFLECRYLKQAPELPATTVGNFAYANMFSGCRGLLSAPELPATNIGNYCYTGMFDGCQNMTSAPVILPAKILKENCYASMFKGCEALTTAPLLPATTLVNNCYNRIFDGCENLNYIELSYKGTLDSAYFDNWVNNVADSGEIFYDGPTATFGASAIPKDDTNRWIITQSPTELRFLANEASTIKYVINGNVAPRISYSYDRTTWTDWDANTVINLATNENIYVKNSTLNLSTSTNNYVQFVMTGSLSSGGDISSMVNYNSLRRYCFYRLFKDCTSLVSSPTLPSTEVVEACYSEMFKGCTNLAAVPALPATVLADSCYKNMFDGCTSLQVAPELPATTLMAECYFSMFKGCTNLTTAPTTLPATTLSNSCYEYMFDGCENITTAPTLPATTLASHCYEYMFNGCKHLQVAPELPATTLADSCYRCMFSNCENLTQAPELPATTLVVNSYAAMFSGCTSLTTAPELPATSLVTGCYHNLFDGCTNLNFINIGWTGDFGLSYFSNWVSGVADSGTFIYKGTYRQYGASAIPKDDTHKWAMLDSEYLKFTAKANNSSVAYSRTGSPNTSGIQISTDEINWTAWDGSARTLNNNDVLYVKNTNSTLSTSTSDYMRFVMTGTIEASGNINAMINDANISAYCFYQMFYNCSSLTKAPILSATTLALSCYEYMFYHCTNLTKCPDLPATTLVSRCYRYMFCGCDSITETPVISAMTMAERCCDSMFLGCDSLTNVGALPATTLANNCYCSMFSGCIGIVQAPELPATTMVQSCYYAMFRDCENLTSAPALPAVALANDCYSEMFIRCSSLVRAPELPATTLSNRCYAFMFKNCSQLSYIKVGDVGNFDSTYFNQWVDGVANSGTFVYAGSDTTRGISAIPSGWTVVSSD